MNQKKCPKCGEMNPAEAVMCWACYTPLNTGGAGATVATATAGAAPAALATGVAAHDDDKEKNAIPPWQIAVLVIGLLVAIGFGVMQFAGGAPPEVPIDPGMEEIMPPMDPTVPQQPVAPTSPNIGGGDVPRSGSTGSIVPAKLPYTMVTPPNPTIDWGVAAIVPTGRVSSAKAAQLAAFARQTFRGTKNRAFQIYVFADSQTAQIFSEYQARRRGAPLTTSDYMALAQIWPRCLARVEFNGRRQVVSYPSRNPNGWWNEQR